MTTPQDAQQFIGRTAVDSEGSKIGKIGEVYLDEQTGVPLWITVATGIFGARQNFAPIDGSRFDGDQVRLAVPEDLIKDARASTMTGTSTRASRMPSTGTTPATSAAARQAGRPGTPTAVIWPATPPGCGAGVPPARPPMRR
jgi:hypothetical protein